MQELATPLNIFRAPDPINKNKYDPSIRVLVDTAPVLGNVDRAIASDWAYRHYIDENPHPNSAVIGGFQVPFESYMISPTDNNTYYVGTMFSRPPQTTQGRVRMYVLRAGTIKAVRGFFNTSGTLATAETSSLYLDVTDTSNNTVGHLVSSSCVNNAVLTPFYNTALAIQVNEGYYLEMRWETPSWSTNPTDVFCAGQIYIDCGIESQQPPPPPGEVDTYGMGAYDPAILGPIGGGSGYLGGIYTSGDVTISTSDTYSTARTKIEGASSGQVVYVNEDVDLNLQIANDDYITIPAGVTLASNRGAGGTSLGGRLKNLTTQHYDPLFYVTGSNVRVTGIRLMGPDPNVGTSGADPLNEGIRVYGSLNNFECDNCDISAFPYAGICYWGDNVTGGLYGTGRGWIHHNYIHHNRRAGLGYGVQIGINATCLIECNQINYSRHHISGVRDESSPWAQGSRWELCYNDLGSYCTNTLLDQHGGNDDSSMSWYAGPNANSNAGDHIYIHHNTIKAKVSLGSGQNQPAVGIRGIPYTHCTVYRNWTWWYDTETYPYTNFRQRVENLGYSTPPPYIKMTVSENLWGENSDPT